MAHFNTLSLRPELMTGIERLGYVDMTDIQAKAIPEALRGTDLVGHARTGSGKTAAFGLAVLNGLDITDRSPQALVLCPTRELADQLTANLRALAVGLIGTRIITVTGGSPMRAQRAAIDSGAHVVVGTPGRVLQHLEQERLNVDKLRYLVLDEADRMLDMGFEEQVLDIISYVPEQRQTLLFSATWPDEMAKLSEQIQREPMVVGAKALVDEDVLRQSAVLCNWDTRDNALCDLLSDREPTPTLVFCETRVQCHDVAEMLRLKGAAAIALHGDLEQRDRDEVLVRMRNRSAQILVATNVAARGLDLENLGLVVCYELSPDPPVHIHRVGRTARAENSGEAVSLVAGPREIRRLEAIEAHMDTKIPRTEWQPTRAGALNGWSAPYRTLVIMGGRKDKLRPGDILGALTKDGGIDGADVGKIVLTDRRAWVAIKAEVANRAANGLNRGRIKKKRFRGSVVQ